MQPDDDVPSGARPAREHDLPQHDLTRRTFMEATGALGGALALSTLPGSPAAWAQPSSQGAGAPAPTPAVVELPVTLRINGEARALTLDARTSLLDALREHLHLTGTKKGCDHGQCGACTILVNGARINACLTLAVMHEGDEITTVEGLARGDTLHPVQAAFLEHDGYQCGYCTPGQIVSAVGMIEEARQGRPSHVTPELTGPVALTEAEIRERMSGNLCRCGAHANIVAAIKEAAA